MVRGATHGVSATSLANLLRLFLSSPTIRPIYTAIRLNRSYKIDYYLNIRSQNRLFSLLAFALEMCHVNKLWKPLPVGASKCPT